MTTRAQAGSVPLWGSQPALQHFRGSSALEKAPAPCCAPRSISSCRGCARSAEPVEGEGLCPACWSKLSFISRPYCERLGIPFVYDPEPTYQRARAAVRFDDVSQALVHALKYCDRLDLAPVMGR